MDLDGDGEYGHGLGATYVGAKSQVAYWHPAHDRAFINPQGNKMKAEDIRPDHINTIIINGLTIRKGTVAAFVANAKTYLQPESSPSERAEAKTAALEALPALQALGIFDVFIIADTVLRKLVVTHQQ